MDSFDNHSAEPDENQAIDSSNDNFIYRTPALLHGLVSSIGGFALKAATEIKDIVTKDISFSSIPVLSAISSSDDTDNPPKKKKKKKKPKSQISQKFVDDSKRLLATADTVFPFTLFPDTVKVDRAKVTIVQRTFFMSSKTITLRIEDILNVSVSIGPIFGAISITTRVMSTVDHYDITFFWRKDAIHLKHIIQGYIIALHRGKNIDKLTNEELLPLLTDLGHE